VQLTVCSSNHLLPPWNPAPSTNRRCKIWKCTGGPPKAVNPRSHIRAKISTSRHRTFSVLGCKEGELRWLRLKELMIEDKGMIALIRTPRMSYNMGIGLLMVMNQKEDGRDEVKKPRHCSGDEDVIVRHCPMIVPMCCDICGLPRWRWPRHGGRSSEASLPGCDWSVCLTTTTTRM
jgi:hypothetical protein